MAELGVQLNLLWFSFVTHSRFSFMVLRGFLDQTYDSETAMGVVFNMVFLTPKISKSTL